MKKNKIKHLKVSHDLHREIKSISVRDDVPVYILTDKLLRFGLEHFQELKS